MGTGCSRCGGPIWEVGLPVVKVCMICGTEQPLIDNTVITTVDTISDREDSEPAPFLTWEQVQAEMRKAAPHKPDEPCTCDGCHECTGHVIGCTCDIDWDRLQELRRDYL